MINYESWKQINLENCSHCKFGSKNFAKIGQAKCFFKNPKTKLHEKLGWVCREFQKNE